MQKFQINVFLSGLPKQLGHITLEVGSLNLKQIIYNSMATVKRLGFK